MCSYLLRFSYARYKKKKKREPDGKKVIFELPHILLHIFIHMQKRKKTSTQKKKTATQTLRVYRTVEWWPSGVAYRIAFAGTKKKITTTNLFRQTL